MTKAETEKLARLEAVEAAGELTPILERALTVLRDKKLADDGIDAQLEAAETRAHAKREAAAAEAAIVKHYATLEPKADDDVAIITTQATWRSSGDPNLIGEVDGERWFRASGALVMFLPRAAFDAMREKFLWKHRGAIAERDLLVTDLSGIDNLPAWVAAAENAAGIPRDRMGIRDLAYELQTFIQYTHSPGVVARWHATAEAAQPMGKLTKQLAERLHQLTSHRVTVDLQASVLTTCAAFHEAERAATEQARKRADAVFQQQMAITQRNAQIDDARANAELELQQRLNQQDQENVRSTVARVARDMRLENAQ